MRAFKSYGIFGELTKTTKEVYNEVSAQNINIFLLRAISVLLIICITCQSILGPLLFHTPSSELIIDIGVFSMLGVIALALSYVRMEAILGNHLVAFSTTRYSFMQ